MIRSFNDKIPKIAESAFVDPMATIIGDVEIGNGSSVWPGAVIRGDTGQIRIGDRVHVEDNVVVHGGRQVRIGDNVFVGHGAVVHGRAIGSNVLIGNGAILLEASEVGSSCVISAGTLIPPRTKIPDRSFVAGIPCVIKGSPSEEQLSDIANGLGYYDKLVQQYKDDAANSSAT